MTGMVDLPVGSEGGRPCACVWIIEGEEGVGGEGDGLSCCCCSKVETPKA